MQSVLNGVQDRLEDLRSYAKKIQLFYSVSGLPDPQLNVISVVLTSRQGVVYKRSLDIDDTTPPASNNPALRLWAAAQLGMSVDKLGPVQYDTDLLRMANANTLNYLASTIGAVLYQTSLVPASQQALVNQRLVNTYFPRLRVKGTLASFEVLGRALGFDDVRVTPLWGRLSPSQPQDVGSPANDADFAAVPDYLPAQTASILYDPLDARDGPYYQWSGTCTNGTADTSFYTSVINGFNPWVSVEVVGSVNNGTAAQPAPGDYPLANGGPNQAAYVEPANSSFVFSAVVEGESMNGLVVSIGSVGFNGTECSVSISDRLSAIKYRSSYFDLGMTVSIDRAVEVFGTQPSSPNPDIVSGSYTPDGVSGAAISPYRPWTGGSLAVTTLSADWYAQTVVAAGTTVVLPRVEATGTNRELIVDNLIAAGIQVAQSLEEVRPATRFPRRAAPGLLLDNAARYACYVSAGTLFTTAGTVHTYSGSHPQTPPDGFTAGITVYSGGEGYPATAAIDPANGTIWDYLCAGSVVYNGTYDFGSGTYFVNFPGSTPNGACAVAVWTVTSSETVRSEPSAAEKASGDFAYQARPEDDLEQDSASFLVNGTAAGTLPLAVYEQADEYPWAREVVGGGEQVEVDSYVPCGAEGVDVLDDTTAFQDQTGCDLDVYGLASPKGLRLLFQYRPYDATYVPGLRAVAYQGTFKDLSTVAFGDTLFIRPGAYAAGGTYAADNDWDALFEPGYNIYHAGVVWNVLVADAVKFFGSFTRDGWVGWLPLNEHPDDDLSVTDQTRTVPVDIVMENVLPDNRLWSEDRGWYLSLPGGASVSVSVDRGLDCRYALSFWFMPSADLSDALLLAYGPLAVDYGAAEGTVGFYAQASGTQVCLGSSPVSVGQFNFVALTTAPCGYEYGVGALGTPLTLTETAGSFAPFDEAQDNTLQLSGGGAGEAGFHDLRIWNRGKTWGSLDLVRYHQPTPSQALYPMAFIQSAGAQDRYGMRVLPNGWITPDVMPAWYRTSRTALIRRYTSDGSYVGPSRFKETGLGGGHDLPAQMFLGYVAPTVEVSGTTVVSGTWGALPGINALWANDTLTLAPMADCNPVRDRIWVLGLDGAVYEMMLSGDAFGTYMNGTACYSGTNIFSPVISQAGTSTQQLTGAEVVLAGSGQKCFWNPAAGTLVQMPGGTITPPQWMYLNQRTTDQYPGVSAWTEAGFSATQQGVDITANPGIVAQAGNPNSALLVAALGQNGVLEFENYSPFPPGRYRLTIQSGNLGVPDQDFNGFVVQLNLNSLLVQTILCQGQSGFNCRGTDVIEFMSATPPISSGGSWLLSVTWTNALANPTTGTARQLAIYGYTLECLATEIFEVSIDPAGLHPNLTSIGYGNSPPGGWLGELNSYGTVVAMVHEGTTYPMNDTVTGQFPLSDILTGMTNDKREDIIVVAINGNSIAPDELPVAMPAFGTLTDS